MKLFRVSRLVIVALVSLASTLRGQAGYIPVSATNLSDATGATVANATISFQPTDSAGNPLSFRAGGPSQGQVASIPVTAQVTDGKFTVSLADTALTNPANVCYNVTVIDNFSQSSILGPGYTCMQPTSIANYWCSAGACNWDLFQPSVPALGPISIGPKGEKGDTGAAGAVAVLNSDGVSGNFYVTGTLSNGAGSPPLLPADPKLPLQAVTKQYADSLNYLTLNVIGDSYFCSQQINVVGAANRCYLVYRAGYGPTSVINSIVGRLATTSGVSMLGGLHNYAGGGAEACDVSALEVFGNALTYTNSKSILMIGLNDAISKGAGPYEDVFNRCHLAATAWVALKSTGSPIVPATACTNVGGTQDATYPAVTGVHFASTGSLDCAISSTSSNPLYIWYVMKDGSGGVFKYSIDGASAVTQAVAEPVAINTTVGGVTAAPGMIRAGMGYGSHTVHFAITAGDVTILAIGTSPFSQNVLGQPVEVVGGVAVEADNANGIATAQYNLDVSNNVAQLFADNLPVKFNNIRNSMATRPSYYLDGLHPGDVQSSYIANSYVSAFTTGQINTWPVVGDNAGTFPNPPYYIELSPTGFGPQWFTDNKAQPGGTIWNHVLQGPDDHNADGTGCEYLYNISPIANTVFSESCSQDNGSALGNFQANFVPQYFNNSTKFHAGGPPDAASAGFTVPKTGVGALPASVLDTLSVGVGSFHVGFYGGEQDGPAISGGVQYANRIFAYQNLLYGTTLSLAPDLHLLQLGGVGGITGISFSASDVRKLADDASISRVSPGVLAVGNGAAGDASGAIQAAVLGPATAPSGSCPQNGAWVFSRDGHATFCAGGTWTTKI